MVIKMKKIFILFALTILVLSSVRLAAIYQAAPADSVERCNAPAFGDRVWPFGTRFDEECRKTLKTAADIEKAWIIFNEGVPADAH